VTIRPMVTAGDIMGILSVLRKSLLSGTSHTGRNLSPMQQFITGNDFVRTSGIRRAYSESVWVYRCANEWRRIGQVTIELVDGDGTQITSGPAAMLIARPNPTQTMRDLIEWLALDLALYGQWFLRKTGGRVPAILVRLDPARMRIPATFRTSMDAPEYWDYMHAGGKYERINAEDLIHCKFPNPYDCRIGLAPLAAASLSVDTDHSARSHNKYQLDRHGRVQGVVAFKDILSQPELDARAQAWHERFEGSHNAGRWAILDNGASVQQLTQSAKEMDWLEGARMTREEICAAFGVPPMVVGIHDHSTYSNYDAALVSLWQDTLMPIAHKTSDALQYGIGVDGTSARLQWQFETDVPVLQASTNERYTRYLALCKGGFITPRTAAHMLNIDIGEEHPAQDEVWIGISDIPYSGDTGAPVGGGGGSDGEEKHAGPIAEARALLAGALQEAKQAEPPAAPAPRSVLPATPAATLRKARGVAIMREALPYERKLSRTLANYFDALRREVEGNAPKLVQSLAKSYGVTKAVTLTDSEIALQLLGGKDWATRLKDAVRPILAAAAKVGAVNLLREVAQPKDKFSDTVVESFVKSQLVIMDEVSNYTLAALRAASGTLIEGIQSGASVESLMTQLRADWAYVLDNTEARRATIARTESLRAINGGRYDQMRAIGVRRKEWIAVDDGDARDSHLACEAQGPIGIDEQFGNGLYMPGDPAGDASETVNCRCTVVASL